MLSRLIGRPTSAIGLTVLAVIVLAAILAPVIAPYAPSKLSIASRLHPPSLDHLFGTDDLGRDVFTRMLYA
ncbi:MAG: ABC transporter permease, partial [Mesorhizobium sp.]